MSYITNVKYGKKFESVDIKLTHEECALLVYMKNRAKAQSGGQFVPKQYLISLFEEDFEILKRLVEPLGRIL